LFHIGVVASMVTFGFCAYTSKALSKLYL